VPLFELTHRAGYPALRAGLLRGYRSVRSLPVSYEHHIEVFVAFRVLQVVLWLIERRHEPGFAGWERCVREDFDALTTAVGRLGRP
jgi:Ser/Thr protein kinase RdoA (MazF antagonist)